VTSGLTFNETMLSTSFSSSIFAAAAAAALFFFAFSFLRLFLAALELRLAVGPETAGPETARVSSPSHFDELCV